MFRIRLRRTGLKKQSTYRVVAADKETRGMAASLKF